MRKFGVKEYYEYEDFEGVHPTRLRREEMLQHVDAAIAGLRTAFDGRHISNVSCSYVVPEFPLQGGGPLTRSHPDIVRKLNRDTQDLHVTRYATAWNLGWFFETEAASGRYYGGKVLEISGRSSIRQYLRKSQTTFVEAIYPAVDVTALDKAYSARSFDMVIAESVLEHVASPFLAVLQMYRVLRDGGHMMLMVPSTCALGSHTLFSLCMLPRAIRATSNPCAYG